LGYDLIAEDTTNFGKIDLTIKMNDKILIVEFKLSKYGSGADAINQLKQNKYADKYKATNIPIYLIGISFDPNTRNVDEMLWECI
jgi:Holliday junction resolvase-like predicted endonuclease